MAIALGTQWIFNIIWSVATPYMIAKLGWGTFLLFAIVDAFSAVFSWFFVRETMGKSLEEMEKEFNSEAAAALTDPVKHDAQLSPRDARSSSSYDAGKV